MARAWTDEEARKFTAPCADRHQWDAWLAAHDARVRRDAAQEALDEFAEWAEGLTAKHPRFEQVDSMAAMMARRFKTDTYPEETP